MLLCILCFASAWVCFYLSLWCVGIGKSLAVRLAAQGVNVVLVALQDGLLDATYSELKAQFPQQSFRKVCPVNFQRSA